MNRNEAEDSDYESDSWIYEEYPDHDSVSLGSLDRQAGPYRPNFAYSYQPNQGWWDLPRENSCGHTRDEFYSPQMSPAYNEYQKQSWNWASNQYKIINNVSDLASDRAYDLEERHPCEELNDRTQDLYLSSGLQKKEDQAKSDESDIESEYGSLEGSPALEATYTQLASDEWSSETSESSETSSEDSSDHTFKKCMTFYDGKSIPLSKGPEPQSLTNLLDEKEKGKNEFLSKFDPNIGKQLESLCLSPCDGQSLSRSASALESVVASEDDNSKSMSQSSKEGSDTSSLSSTESIWDKEEPAKSESSSEGQKSKSSSQSHPSLMPKKSTDDDKYILSDSSDSSVISRISTDSSLDEKALKAIRLQEIEEELKQKRESPMNVQKGSTEVTGQKKRLLERSEPMARTTGSRT